MFNKIRRLVPRLDPNSRAMVSHEGAIQIMSDTGRHAVRADQMKMGKVSRKETALGRLDEENRQQVKDGVEAEAERNQELHLKETLGLLRKLYGEQGINELGIQKKDLHHMPTELERSRSRAKWVIYPLTQIFEMSVKRGMFPQRWKC